MVWLGEEASLVQVQGLETELPLQGCLQSSLLSCLGGHCPSALSGHQEVTALSAILTPFTQVYPHTGAPKKQIHPVQRGKWPSLFPVPQHGKVTEPHWASTPSSVSGLVVPMMH